MENLTASFLAGADGNGNYFTGDLGFVALDKDDMTAADVWKLWLSVKAYYGI